MALGLNTESGGGDYSPIIKFDARAGRLFRVDRTQGAAGWQTDNVEITNGFQGIFDLENIEVGWALFAAGAAPQMSLAKIGTPSPAKPSDQHKQAFRVMVKLAKSAGGDVREMAATSKAVIGSIDALHSAYEAGKAANSGMLPLVALTGSKPIISQGQGQTSTNYAPVFEIVKWVPRPADMSGVAPAAAPAPAPAPAPQPAPAMADGDEF